MIALKLFFSLYTKRMLLVLIGILGFILSNFSTAWADETIRVEGQVGSVIAGPSSPENSDKDDTREKNAIPTASQPSVSVEPANIQGAVFSTISGIPQFTTPRPAFRGQTNIQNANITLIFSFGEFTFRATTQADPAGIWNFLSPEDFPNGSFEVTILATHPTESTIKAETHAQFHVLALKNTHPWSEQFLQNSSVALFDLSARVQDQYKVVAPGENIIASISLVNFSATGSPIDIIVEYSIQDEEGREILHLKETVAVATKLSFLKTFYTQPDLKEGVYRLIVKTPSRNTIAVASTEFIVKGKGTLAITSLAKVDYSAVLIGVGAVFATFIFLSYFEFIRFLRVKKRIHLVTSKFLKRFF